jgi:uncharacterized protein YbbK (DUF523 family)
MIVVSACLVGVDCRYNGVSVHCEKAERLYKEGRALPVCPEMLAGFSSPRMPGEIRDGRVYNSDGTDATEAYMRGARIAYDVVLSAECTVAVLKSKSPTCGCGKIYDGTFSSKMIDGDGVFVALLRKKGLTLYTEETVPADL